MPTLAELTEDQFKLLLDEYFAPPGKRQKLTQAEVLELAKKLNEKINVPIIAETGEEKILVKIVVKIDTFLYDNLPNEFYDLIRSSRNGISDEEAKRLIKRLANLANDKIDIPYVPETMEYIAIRFVIGIVVNAARKNWNLKSARANAHRMVVPNEPTTSDFFLDAMIG